MSDHLAARGRGVETLFGFVGDERLALVPWALFREDVQLPPDADGAVRCRLAGLPAVLVRAHGALHLDVAVLATHWPRLFSELSARIGEEAARALVAREPIVRVLDSDDALKELILAHQIRAENLLLLGDDSTPPRAPEGARTFSLRFEQGTLELTYTKEAFERAPGAPGSGVEARWNDAPLALPSTEAMPWREEELAELAVLGSLQAGPRPKAVLELFDRAFPGGPSAATGGDAVLATLLNVWGVVRRKTGDPRGALEPLRRALPIAEKADPQLEQQVRYNLGYALLQTTMRSRAHLGRRDGVEHYTADYDLGEEHRSTWQECLAHFERAAELDPNDATARSQIDQTTKLLALLDVNANAPERRPKTGGPLGPTEPPARRAPRARATPKTSAADWVPLVLVLVILAVLAYWIAGSWHGVPAPQPSNAQGSSPAPREPSARERSDAARAALLDRFDVTALPAPGAAPCALAVTPPRDVSTGEVVAPHVGRSATGELYGTDYFDATIRQYAARFAPELEVRPATREGVGPVLGAPGPSAWALRSRDYALTLLVMRWRDPIVVPGEDAFTPGEIEARLLVWSYASSRFVCTASVIASQSAPLSIVRSADPLGDEDDVLNRARLDLIEQALRAGIPELWASADDAATRDDSAPSEIEAPVPQRDDGASSGCYAQKS